MFPFMTSISTSPSSPLTLSTPQEQCTENDEDQDGSSWGTDSGSSRQRSSHMSRTHTFRHEAHQRTNPVRNVHRSFGNLDRSQDPDAQERAMQDAELPHSTSSNPTAHIDLEEAVNTSQDAFPSVCIPDSSRPFASSILRSKSLERQQLETTAPPDLINFKKGWMSRLGEDGKWRKHWFVLTDQTLRFYRDTVAEEAADLDGEINLSTCYDVTDYPVQKNYGFQIHTNDGVLTLFAITYGIRRNWVQAIIKNICPAIAPDVTWTNSAAKSSCIHQACSASSQTKPVSQEEVPKSRIRDRRRAGRYKTLDCAELTYKQKKGELPDELLESQWHGNSECSVPPAPASSPVGPTKPTCSEEIQIGYPQRVRPSRGRSLNIISANASFQFSQMAVHSRTSPESISPDSLEVDAAQIRLLYDHSGEALEAEPQDEKKIDRSTSPLQVIFSSSSSVQTEWQWDLELQSLRREFKVLLQSNQTQEKDFKLTEAQLQTELSDSRKCLQQAESRIQETEAILRKREEVVDSLRGQLEEITMRLKANDEAEALKGNCIQKHLLLLQESQEHRRKNFSDCLDQSKQQSSDLKKCFSQKETGFQKEPPGETPDDLLRRCQELQNQLDESDSEVGRLQARLQTEETLYYDLEHDFERASEEIQSLQGALLDYERMSEERFQAQLLQHHQELDKKECKLKEVLVKLSVLGSSLEETELKLKQAQAHPFEGKEVLAEQCKQKFSDTELTVEGGGSHRVISVILALEHKLCDTEERLQELTLHLRQQQHLNNWPHKHEDCRSSHGSLQNSGKHYVDSLPTHMGPLQESPLNRRLYRAKFPFRRDESLLAVQVSRVLYLETLIIQRIATVLEHPRKHFMNQLSVVYAKVLRIAQRGGHDELDDQAHSQIFLDLFEQDLQDDRLNEGAIEKLCVRAEIAYLLNSLHTKSSKEETFYASPYLSSDFSSKNKMGSMQRTKLADVSPPELASYSEGMEDEVESTGRMKLSDIQLTCRKSLVAELRAQAQSLQNISVKLESVIRDDEIPSGVPADLMKAVTNQAILAYMACRLRSALQQEMTAIHKRREEAELECQNMETIFQEQTERYEEKFLKERDAVEKAEQELFSAQTNAEKKREEVERLQMEFEVKLQELQKIHEEEMRCLHEDHMLNASKSNAPNSSEQVLHEEIKQNERVLQIRIKELEDKVTFLNEELCKKEILPFDLDTIKATYEHGFCVIEESHQQVIKDMQRQHQREVERLMKDKERVLQEETNATIAAIEAMRKAHKEEMDKTQKALLNGSSVNICQLHAQYKEEQELLHRELEVLSEQYSQKCLDNINLTQTIEREREALRSTLRENRNLHTHNQELNECLTSELSLMHSRINGNSLSTQQKDVYQLEVNLRVKEYEIKCLKQEVCSLKLELQAENKNCEDLDFMASAPGFNNERPSKSSMVSAQAEPMNSRDNSDFIKEHSELPRSVRSKRLKDGLTVMERMKLFE